MTKIVLYLVAVIAGPIFSGCHSTNLNPAIGQLWVCHASGEYERVIENSWVILTDKSVTFGDQCTCLFLRGDSLRQLGRFTDACSTLNRAALCNNVFWLDHSFVGKMALQSQLRLSRALTEVGDRTAFPTRESEYLALMLRYYGRNKDSLADEVAKACASACIAKSEASNCVD